MHRKMGRGAQVAGQGGKKGSILIIRYHNSRRSLSHSRYIADTCKSHTKEIKKNRVMMTLF
jgi:hypothetical protein